jgi:predicted RNA-binding protein with PIN domain
MPVPVIIDGYNLLYARGEAPAAETRARLVTDVVAWARARNRRVVLVFDAWAGGMREARQEAHGPVTVWFTRAGERADAFIVRWVGEHPESVVVTSDSSPGSKRVPGPMTTRPRARPAAGTRPGSGVSEP